MRLCRMPQLYALALIALICFGCNRSISQSVSTPEPALAIQSINSPTADNDSREPNLHRVDDGRIILSWVEKAGEKKLHVAFVAA